MEHRANKWITTTLISIGANIFLAFIKGIAGIFGNSFAMISDAIESLTDVVSSIIVWIGLKISMKNPDEKHPYGYGKAEPIAAIIVAFSLIFAAIMIVRWSLYYIYTEPNHPTPAYWTLIVLIIVLIIKFTLFKKIGDVGDEIESTAVKWDAWHHMSDALTSLCAWIGILIWILGWPATADDWGALLASSIIFYNAYNIFRPAFLEIMDRAPHEDMIHEITDIAEKVPGVKNIHHCIIKKVGFDYFIEIHVVVDGNISVREWHAIGHNVHDTIIQKKSMIRNVITHVEPWYEVVT